MHFVNNKIKVVSYERIHRIYHVKHEFGYISTSTAQNKMFRVYKITVFLSIGKYHYGLGCVVN